VDAAAWGDLAREKGSDMDRGASGGCREARRGWCGRPARGLVVAAIALTMVAAACGDDDDDTAASSATTGAGASATTAAGGVATTAGGSTAAPSGDPYVIGNLLEIETPFATYPPSYKDTPIAFEKWVNANGGINGRPLKVVQIDDHADAGKSLAAAQQLVEQDKVIAFAGNNNVSTESAYEQYISDAGVPVVGSAYSSIAAENPNWFQTGAGSYVIAGYSRALAAKEAGVTRYGIMYCTEVPACKLDYSNQEDATKKIGGITVVKTIPAAIASPNFTAPCVQMKNEGIEGLYFSSSVEGIARAAVDCARQGLEVVHVMGESGPQLLQTKEVWEHGAAGADMSLPYWAEVPGTANYHAAMKQYFPDDELTAASAQEWAAFEVLKAALEKVPNDPPSKETVKKGLYALPDGFKSDMSLPVHYAEGKPSVVNCFYLWQIKDGKYELTKGTDFQCAQ
jgi:branched-chain amino acid transport system substrate-binding protein